jgi:hypothetical protein
LSKYNVVTPSLISEAIIPNVLDTIKALSRINSISSRDFTIIMVSNFSVGKSTLFKGFYNLIYKYTARLQIRKPQLNLICLAEVLAL